MLLIVVFFLGASYFSRQYQESIADFVRGAGILAQLVYVAVCAFAVVVPPVTAWPFLPAASHAWGFLGAGMLTAAGGVIGGVISFLIARYFGQAVVRKLMPQQSLERVHDLLPHRHHHVFWTIVLLQFLTPTDILSYAVGLFTRIRLGTYALAITVGNVPGALMFAYLGKLPLQWQILGLVVAGTVFGTVVFAGRRERR